MKNGITKSSIPQKMVEIPFLLLTGGVVYYGIEVLYRGWSHFSMAICGALCFWIIYRFNEKHPHLLLPVRALFGAAVITASELICGCIVNLWLGLGVWDYTQLPFNLWGQICLPFCILWFLLCIPVSWLSYFVRRKIFYAPA